MTISSPKAVILGLSGTSVTDEEAVFFEKHNPLGFILFARNVKDKVQLQQLTRSLRELVGREDAPILIDQEGGKVARLKPPHFRDAPAAEYFATMAQDDIEAASYAVYENGLEMAQELIECGINVDCAPVADLLFDDADEIIGSRSYGTDPTIVSLLARKMAEGLQAGGVTPIIKHIPGHGRAMVDSHKDLPIISTPLETLEETDFKVFALLKDLPWAMTAHIIYDALDVQKPVTLSKKAIDYIRNIIGFKGVLISDDISMHALKGDFKDRVEGLFEAGCDLALHCNGEMEEMEAFIEVVPLV